ncbi:hypothetical protein [Roseibium sp. RKSG952]|uniref:hypothetical protein n=1 Tax=Roseibium sp. RKSG952 TaxID=2529384 RepID=UPI0012BB7543|nr:hypothetical protein [Roseibium sp. RKSG952]MTH94821.1 hypothetical protein [Roseibium sp. RKSG952]
MTDKHRYISTDYYWGHIFDEKIGEIMTQWVYDTQTKTLVGALIASNRSWVPASDEELADIEDSIKNANPDSLENPDDWGLSSTEEIPEAFRDIVSSMPTI